MVDSLKNVFNSDIVMSHKDDIEMVIRELGLPQISTFLVSWLEKPFTDKEIRDVMFSMGDSKSPGPDGFTAGFFKKHWIRVGFSVCKVVRSFLTTGYLLKEWNHSLLVMIPKKRYSGGYQASKADKPLQYSVQMCFKVSGHAFEVGTS